MFHSKLKETLNHSIAKVTSEEILLFLIRKKIFACPRTLSGADYFVP